MARDPEAGSDGGCGAGPGPPPGHHDQDSPPSEPPLNSSAAPLRLAPRLRLDALDGLRGFAAIIVVVGHLLTYWCPRIDAPWPAFGLEYLSPVTLFFVISGFTLVYAYDRPTSLRLRPGGGQGGFGLGRVPAGGPGSPGGEADVTLGLLAATRVHESGEPEESGTEGGGDAEAPTAKLLADGRESGRDCNRGASPKSAADVPPASGRQPPGSTGAASLLRDADPSTSGIDGAGAAEAAPLSTPTLRWAFLWRRVARLAPIYYVSLLVAIAPLVTYFSTLEIAVTVPVSLLWLQAWLMNGNTWNGPLWTASAFVGCYVLFPWILAGLRRRRPAGLWGVLAACSGASALIVLVWIPAALATNAFDSLGAMHSFGGFRLLHFVVGVCAGLLAARPERTGWGPGAATAIAEACSALLLASMGLCWALTALTRNAGVWFLYAYLAEFLLPPVHALWLMALTQPGCSGPTRWVLASPPARWLGEISYALYCLHWPTIFWCAWAAAGKGVSADALPAQARGAFWAWFAFPLWGIVPVLAACVAVAAAAHACIERPARRAMTRASRG